MHRSRVAFALLVTLWALPLAAHDFWLVPSSFRPAVGSPLALRLRVGENLKGDPVPRDTAQVERFVLRGPLPAGAEVPIAGPPGADPAGFVRVGEAGLYTVVYRSRRTRLDLPPEKFDEALRREGLERILELRQSRGESLKPSTEVFSRCAKALVLVGGTAAPAGPSASAGFERPVGMTLELIPEKNPYGLKPGEELPLRLLYQGKPLADALVIALGLHQTDGKLAARSGKDGRVRLRLPEGGFWLIKSVHMVPAPTAIGVDWESLWASLTFDLPAR
ncbi:MAG TPA: DUF4198 domain-containing protein [Thermoanaerobaculia bacterium]|nr:DUF4198 domain-containing protein [Thermoanaerobaculia bacterium]